MSSLFHISQCTVCLELNKDPRLLSCGHTFCAVCLGRMIRRNSFINTSNFIVKFNRCTITCPVCNTSVDVTEARVEGLPKNFAVAHLVDWLHQCSFGHSDRALHYCVDCQLSLCESCCKGHSEADSPTAGHLIKTLDNVTNLDARSRQNARYRPSLITSSPQPDDVIGQSPNFLQINAKRFIEMCKRLPPFR